MFFGFEVKSGQKQAKPIELSEKNLKLSQACLEPTKNTKKEPVSLMVEYEKKQFILAVLDPSLSWQAPLDILFEAGSEVRFFLKGTGTVHITGYYDVSDDLDDISVDMSSDAEISESESDEEPVAVPEKKRRTSESMKAKSNGHGSPNKKKTNPKKRTADELDEDDEDDDDFMADVGTSDDDDDDKDLESDSDIDEDDGMSDEEISDDSDELK